MSGRSLDTLDTMTQFTHLESKAVENSQIPHDDSARAFFALLNLEFARVEAKFVRRLGVLGAIQTCS